MRYTLEVTTTGSKIATHVTRDFLDQVTDTNPRFETYFTRAVNLGTIQRSTTQQGADQVLLFDFNRAFLKRTPERRRLAASGAYMSFMAIANYASVSDEGDSDLQLEFSNRRLGDGVRLGMDATISRPKAGTDEEIAAHTTKHMHSTARQLRYPPESRFLMAKLVGAAFDTQTGVSLVALTSGSSTLDTDGDEYNPTSKKNHITRPQYLFSGDAVSMRNRCCRFGAS